MDPQGHWGEGNGGAATSTFGREPEAPFLVEVGRLVDGTVRASISGEIDLTTSPAFQEQIEGLATPRTDLVLDLGGVSFMDSTGLRALWTIRQRFAAVEGRLLLTTPSESVVRLLQLTKLDKVFEYDPSGSTG